MGIEINEEPFSRLGQYATISIAFEVDRVFDVIGPDAKPSDVVLIERAIPRSYWKDYDVDGQQGPLRWADHFDLSNWVLLAARSSARLVGGAVLALRTPALTMLEQREDLAVLWDIRVAPEHRGRGVGHALFRAAEASALARACNQLKIETQNVNVSACRFYEDHGCHLGGIDRAAYSTAPDEIQLLWYKNLRSPPRS